MSLKRMEIGLACAVITCLASCSNNSSTSSTDPTLTINAPANGDSVGYDANSTDVNVTFTVTNVTLKDPGTCGATPHCGHVELFIDGMNCNDHSDPTKPHPYNTAASMSPTTAGLDYCPNFPAVDGQHVLRAELHNDDLSPLLGSNGQVISAQVTFTARMNPAMADGGAPGDMSMTGPCGSTTNPILVGPLHSFSPTDCKVAAGSTVHWKWNGGLHSVTSDPGAALTFDSGTQTTGTFQFDIPAGTASGTVINYHCTVHASFPTGNTCQGMCATLRVL
jgi:plastocyanin